MNASDIAAEIYQEIGEPAEVPQSMIIYWLISNVGMLNLLLGTCFVINSSDNSILPLMGTDEKTIFKLLYEKYYYNKLLNTILSTAAYDSGSIQSVTEGNRTVKLNSKTEVAKSYQSVLTGIIGGLSTLVQAYKMNQNVPLEIIYESYPELPYHYSLNYGNGVS